MRESIKCPCAKWRNMVYLTPDEVKMHFMYKSFVKGYWFWISHGEVNPQQYDLGIQIVKFSELEV